MDLVIGFIGFTLVMLGMLLGGHGILQMIEGRADPRYKPTRSIIWLFIGLGNIVLGSIVSVIASSG